MIYSVNRTSLASTKNALTAAFDTHFSHSYTQLKQLITVPMCTVTRDYIVPDMTLFELSCA